MMIYKTKQINTMSTNWPGSNSSESGIQIHHKTAFCCTLGKLVKPQESLLKKPFPIAP